MTRVLIVDDSKMCRDRVRALLADLPDVTIVAEAENAGQAVEMYQRCRPDVVVLDLLMPGGSGFNILRRLKAERLAPAVIVLSNLAAPEYRSASEKAGAEFFFDKSFEFERVKEVIGSLVTSAPPPLSTTPAAPSDPGEVPQ